MSSQIKPLYFKLVEIIKNPFYRMSIFILPYSTGMTGTYYSWKWGETEIDPIILYSDQDVHTCDTKLVFMVYWQTSQQIIHCISSLLAK
jgi:hypothetical protein